MYLREFSSDTECCESFCATADLVYLRNNRCKINTLLYLVLLPVCLTRQHFSHHYVLGTLSSVELCST